MLRFPPSYLKATVRRQDRETRGESVIFRRKMSYRSDQPQQRSTLRSSQEFQPSKLPELCEKWDPLADT